MEKKKRAVAYCRVSTDKEEQKTSIKSQRTELSNICEEMGWYKPKINVENICDNGVYYDEGTSGTKLSRPAFDRLLLDAGLTPIVDADTDKNTTTYKIDKKPKFDVIVVKDASRFSRNMSVNSIMQTLKDNGVYVYFCNLQMTTEKNENWSIIQQFFVFAEQESRRKSDAVKFGIKAGIEQGKVYYGGKMIGYDYDRKNNRLVVNEEEAKLVRRVYDMYTEEGLGQSKICNALAEEGFYTKDKNGNSVKYGRSTIARMLQNEKYCGISNSGRYYKPDLFNKKKKERDYNDPIRVKARKAQAELEAQGIVKIEPIISIEQFKKAQEICANNSAIFKATGERHGTTDYSKKIVCGCCGAYYRASGRRESKKYGHYKVYGDTRNDNKISRYVCKHTVVYDEAHGIPKCTNPSILEPELDKALFGRGYWVKRSFMIEELIGTSDLYIRMLTNALNADNAQAVEELENQIEELKEKRSKIIDLYADGVFDKAKLDKMNADYTEQINSLTARQQQLSKGNDEIYKDIEQIKELVKEAKAEKAEVEKILDTEKYPKKTRRELLRDVEKITINEHGRPQITFKSIELIKTTLYTLGIMIENYAEAEEAGWEEEVRQAEEWERNRAKRK